MAKQDTKDVQHNEGIATSAMEPQNTDNDITKRHHINIFSKLLKNILNCRYDLPFISKCRWTNLLGKF